MTRHDVPPVLRDLVTPERWEGLRSDGPIVTRRGEADTHRRNRRFEGLYGRLYNQVIQHRRLRRAAFSVWGSADPLYDLETFVADAVAGARARSGSPVLVDLPSGGGTLLPFLARDGFSGVVLEVDLALAMLRRAVALHGSRTPELEVAFLQDDALDLSLADDVADVVVSVNGLHVVPDPARFVAELARVIRPGGTLWLITPVDGRSVRSRVILAAAQAFAITPRRPPTLPLLHELLAGAGFAVLRSYGGASITGLACRRD